MKRAPQGRYTREFRQEAVKLVLEENLSFQGVGCPYRHRRWGIG